MDIFENFIRCISYETGETNPQSHTNAKVSKYADDISALQERYGELRGKQITIQLTELRVICPRKRCRIEAYQGLKSTLQKDYQCYLTILSQKTKQ